MAACGSAARQTSGNGRISRRATVPGLYLCGFFTPPVGWGTLTCCLGATAACEEPCLCRFSCCLLCTCHCEGWDGEICQNVKWHQDPKWKVAHDHSFFTQRTRLASHGVGKKKILKKYSREVWKLAPNCAKQHDSVNVQPHLVRWRRTRNERWLVTIRSSRCGTVWHRGVTGKKKFWKNIHGKCEN